MRQIAISLLKAIVENMSIKSSTFQKLDLICKPSCILASNTSSLPITEIAAVTNAAGKSDWDAFYEPGSGNETGGNHPWAGHFR